MTQFRWQRGSLDESMKTVVEVADKAALIALLAADELKPFGEVNEETVAISDPFYDERIGWNTYYVTINGKCCGMTDGPL